MEIIIFHNFNTLWGRYWKNGAGKSPEWFPFLEKVATKDHNLKKKIIIKNINLLFLSIKYLT